MRRKSPNRLNRRSRQARYHANRHKKPQYETLEQRIMLSGTPPKNESLLAASQPLAGPHQGPPAWALETMNGPITMAGEIVNPADLHKQRCDCTPRSRHGGTHAVRTLTRAIGKT